ncbi:MAG TPA: DUF1343 domain-containing protein, partial [Acidobacteriota bacterium]|nr:DUF1343 domain-containing protein [Acidobacteriota bacterium]
MPGFQRFTIPVSGMMGIGRKTLAERSSRRAAPTVLLRVGFLFFLFSCMFNLPGRPGKPEYPQVLNGIDVLREMNFAPLAGKRVGLITNHTGLAIDGVSTIDLLHETEVCDLVALFSPEHGIRGLMDGRVYSSTDERTGLPIHSLYGNTRRPTVEMLENIDVLVFDIQDIGARFYTYITTMAYCMEAAAQARIPFFVLDRPNPIGGIKVEGPMLDEDKTSFVGYMPLPVRHGMTVGELARYFNEENGIGVQLHVIEIKGWRRSFYFWDTGQLWVNPSPNMRSMTAAILYPGVCLLEMTNVSVGRGTDRPFEMVGAPWIDPTRFAASLRETAIPGVRFVPVYFTPDTGKNHGEKCGGVSFIIEDREKLYPVTLGLTLIAVLHSLYPDSFQMDNVMTLLGNAEVMNGLRKGQMPAEEFLRRSPEFLNFLDKRRKALIYDSESGRRE